MQFFRYHSNTGVGHAANREKLKSVINTRFEIRVHLHCDVPCFKLIRPEQYFSRPPAVHQRLVFGFLKHPIDPRKLFCHSVILPIIVFPQKPCHFALPLPLGVGIPVSPAQARVVASFRRLPTVWTHAFRSLCNLPPALPGQRFFICHAVNMLDGGEASRLDVQDGRNDQITPGPSTCW